HVAAEASPRGNERHDQGNADHDQHRNGDAYWDLQATRWLRDVVRYGVLVGQRVWPEVVIGDPHRAENRRAADDENRCGGPYRRHDEAELTSSAAIDQRGVADAYTGKGTDDPAGPFADRA